MARAQLTAFYGVQLVFAKCVCFDVPSLFLTSCKFSNLQSFPDTANTPTYMYIALSFISRSEIHVCTYSVRRDDNRCVVRRLILAGDTVQGALVTDSGTTFRFDDEFDLTLDEVRLTDFEREKLFIAYIQNDTATCSCIHV